MSKPIPVAWITKGGTGDLWWHKGSKSDIPLYLEPQKREWVGLTGDEIEDLPKGGTWWEIIRAAEAILKEKNGG